MNFTTKEIAGRGIRISARNEEGREIGRAFLYLLNNDLHQKPFGLMEDLLVAEEMRGQGIGTKLVQELIREAKKQGCYKVICTSRYGKDGVHKMYEGLGFKNHGLEFRLDF